MHKNIFRIAAVSGGVAVLLGAFGAHGLESLAEQGKIETQRLSTWHTAVQYQMYHTFALCFLSLAYTHLKIHFANYAKVAFISGIVIFSGSLYLLTISPIIAGKEMSWLGAVTPLGGLACITGWVCLLLAAKK